MKKTLLLLLAFVLSCHSFAQISTLEEDKLKMNIDEKVSNEEEEGREIEEREENEDIRNNAIFVPDSVLVAPEAWDKNFDTLLNSWYEKQFTNKLNHSGYQENVPTSDSVYMDRLSKLPNIIELPYNETIRRCISLYVDRRRDLTERMLGLETFYFPMIEETLDKYGLPLELKYLTIIESALNPVALSKAGASGLWQFIISTGKIYGLEINSLIDERRDPIKATDAACRHLKDLYDTYGDWNLVIAAYNCGGGNVNKAIRRAGGKKDYWTIYPYLPKETRSYVPFFIAANYVMNYYAYHQLYPVQISLPLSTDTVMISQMIHFDQIAEVLQIEKDMIRALNPQYKRDIIPGNIHPQILKLPAIQAYAFVEKENEIVAHRAAELFTNRSYVESKTAVNSSEKIYHKVRSGENITTIADRYGVTAASVRKWNGLKSNRIIAGKNLVLYVNNGGYTASNTTTPPSSKPVTKPSSSASASASSSSTSAPKTNSSTRTANTAVSLVQYKVQPGDSFYTIAQKYPGYSSTDLMRLNNVTKTALKAGQYILVPKF